MLFFYHVCQGNDLPNSPPTLIDQKQIFIVYSCIHQVAKLTGHSYRVLYLAMSPDGEAIVTGAGDETLRFWNVFSKARSQKESKSALNLFTSIR